MRHGRAVARQEPGPVAQAVRRERSLRATALALMVLGATLASGAGPAAASAPVPRNAALPQTPAYAPRALRALTRTIRRPGRTVELSVVVDTAARVHALAAYALAAATPGSPLYGHFLTPAQVMARFGPPATVRASADAAMARAGWHVLGQRGLVTVVRVRTGPGVGVPVSGAIWSIAGPLGTHVVPDALVRPLPRPGVAGASGASRRGTEGKGPRPASHKARRDAMAGISWASQLAPYGFRLPPTWGAKAILPDGDMAFVVSFNPLLAAGGPGVPAGLPVNFVVGALNASGEPVPLSVTSVSDAQGVLVSYGNGSAFPGTQNTLWQVTVAASQAISAGDTLTLRLGGGGELTAVLPAFTGHATALGPLTGPQLAQLSGASSLLSGASASAAPTVAIYDQGAPPNLADLDQLMRQEGLAVPSVTIQYEDGAGPAAATTSRSELAETAEDLEAVASVAPGVHIVEYVYPDNDAGDPLVNLLTLLSQGGQGDVRIATFSYGFFGEDAATLTTLADACAAEGITLIKGSGDQGAWEGGTGGNSLGVDALDGVPTVLTVGGLNLAAPGQVASDGNTVAVDGPAIAKAWGGMYLNALPVPDAQAYVAPNAASTGGFGSAPVPSWQAWALPPDATGVGVPDVANLAGEPGMLGVQDGQSVSDGGTSLAAPVTAGLLADLEGSLGVGGKGLGALGPLLFAAARHDPVVFTQALWGANGVYSVTSSASGSWNPVTGLGLVNWGALAAAYPQLTAPATAAAHVTVTAARSRALAGTPVNVTVTVRSAQGTPLLGVPVSVSTFGVATVAAQSWVTNVHGQVTATAYADAVGRTVIRASAPSGAAGQAVLIYEPVVRVVPVVERVRVGQAVRLAISATDAGGHPLKGLPVQLVLPRGVVRVGRGALRTGSNGAVVVYVVRHTAGGGIVQASIAGVTARATVGWRAVRSPLGGHRQVRR